MRNENQYNQIYQVWKSERQATELLAVSSSIYSKIRQKIRDLSVELEKLDPTEEMTTTIISERINRLNKILRDLTKIRTHKIIHGVLNDNLKPEGLAIEEKELVRNLQLLFDEHDQRCILGEITIETTKECSTTMSEKLGSSKNQELVTVRILQDIPEILDITAKEGEIKRIFGPFKKEDVVRLPMIYAKTLIMKNAADEIDITDI